VGIRRCKRNRSGVSRNANMRSFVEVFGTLHHCWSRGRVRGVVTSTQSSRTPARCEAVSSPRGRSPTGGAMALLAFSATDCEWPRRPTASLIPSTSQNQQGLLFSRNLTSSHPPQSHCKDAPWGNADGSPRQEEIRPLTPSED